MFFQDPLVSTIPTGSQYFGTPNPRRRTYRVQKSFMIMADNLMIVVKIYWNGKKKKLEIKANS